MLVGRGGLTLQRLESLNYHGDDEVKILLFITYSNIRCVCHRSASISAEQAHDAMLQFVSEHCCYGKTPAREMAIRDIFPSSSYHVSS